MSRAPTPRKRLSADALFRQVYQAFQALPDPHPHHSGSLADALMSGFAVFALKDPSLLAFDERRRQDAKNLEMIFHIGDVPCDTPGRFSLRQVEDEERGPCLELELHGDSALSDYIGEYCAITAAKPAPLPGEPHTLGLWVKGNSSWGKVVFEFQDAAGTVWRTHANEWHDWPGELSINFDGWHFIQFPIDARSPIIYSSPGGR